MKKASASAWSSSRPRRASGAWISPQPIVSRPKNLPGPSKRFFNPNPEHKRRASGCAATRLFLFSPRTAPFAPSRAASQLGVGLSRTAVIPSAASLARHGGRGMTSVRGRLNRLAMNLHRMNTNLTNEDCKRQAGGTPPYFLQVFISGDFKSNDFVNAHSKGFVGAFFASAYSKGFAGIEVAASVTM